MGGEVGGKGRDLDNYLGISDSAPVAMKERCTCLRTLHSECLIITVTLVRKMSM